MKTYLALFAFLGLVTLTGCSADDLTGPDAASNTSLTQTASSESAEARAPTEFTVAGAWRASDASGSITLFLDDLNSTPEASINATGPIGGKGIVSDFVNEPVVVTVEGEIKVRDITFTINDTRGSTIAKAEGVIARDFSAIKVILIDGSERERTLTFERF